MDDRRLLSPTGTTLVALEKHVYQQLKAMRSELDGKALLVAVSGGVDSIVLLRVLANLKTRLGFDLYCGHINHGVRPGFADEDAEFVASFCDRLKIKYLMTKLTGVKISASENTLRQLRYEALSQMAKKLKAAYTVTAHHHDDLLETRLIRLLQGTGVHGLKAMTLVNSDRVLRPLLTVTRLEIEKYAKQRNLDWRHDFTNNDTKKLRNWVRHQWLGVLRRDHPEYLGALHQSLERLTQPGESSDKEPGPLFDRTLLISNGLVGMSDSLVYNYLRQYSKKRVTNALVMEFKKQLVSRRKNFVFRLAGVEWRVVKNKVTPS